MGESALTPDERAAVVAAIEAARDEILAALNLQAEQLRRKIEVSDVDLSKVIQKFQDQVERLVDEARTASRVGLRLDDLFDAVMALTDTAESIDAVDLEVNRWEDDARAQEYFKHNLSALARGAVIRRVYVVAPGATEQSVSLLGDTFRRHIKCNDNKKVKVARGRIEVAAIAPEDLPPDRAPRDFAIFDKDKLLYEEFQDWRTTFRGRLTKLAVDIDDAEEYFEATWNAATPLQSKVDVDQWEQATRARIARKDYIDDLFVGYCSSARMTAESIVSFFRRINYSVRDWRTFPAGPSLLDEIDRACRECRLGLFLFTKDDSLEGGDWAPRDNVVLEMGFFLSGKGPSKVVVVLEDGAKQPTDIQGNIWIDLANRSDIRSIETRLREWIESQIGPGEVR